MIPTEKPLYWQFALDELKSQVDLLIESYDNREADNFGFHAARVVARSRALLRAFKAQKVIW